MNIKRSVLIAGLTLGVLTVSASSVFALTETEKSQKREALNTYYDKASKRIVPEGTLLSHAPLKITGTASSRLGYDDNVDLDESGDGDFYHRQRIAGKTEVAVPGLEFSDRPVMVGSKVQYYMQGYFDRNDLDRQGGELSPYVTHEILPTVTLEGGYGYRFLDYHSRDELNYTAQSFRGQLKHKLTPNFTHWGEFEYEELQYDDRKHLDGAGFFTTDQREDERTIVRYEVRHKIQNIRWNLRGTWMSNDSNDEFQEYNDYEDFGLDGSASWRTFERWLFTGFGGWHQRDYDSRLFLSSSTPQEDDWYYLGGRVFFLINAWSGVDVTVIYSENQSNDPDHDYERFKGDIAYHLFF